MERFSIHFRNFPPEAMGVYARAYPGNVEVRDVSKPYDIPPDGKAEFELEGKLELFMAYPWILVDGKPQLGSPKQVEVSLTEGNYIYDWATNVIELIKEEPIVIRPVEVEPVKVEGFPLMLPWEGPPLPRSSGIYWPWRKITYG